MLLPQMHADIRYSDELGGYVIKDHATQNGTFVNGARICPVSTHLSVTKQNITLISHF